VGILGHHPGDERNFQEMEFVGEAVISDRQETGITEDDLIGAGGSGVAFKGSLDICGQKALDSGQAVQEAAGNIFGPTIAIGAAVSAMEGPDGIVTPDTGKAKSSFYLFLKNRAQTVQGGPHVKVDTVCPESGKTEISRKQNGAQGFDDFNDHIPGGKWLVILIPAHGPGEAVVRNAQGIHYRRQINFLSFIHSYTLSKLTYFLPLQETHPHPIPPLEGEGYFCLFTSS